MHRHTWHYYNIRGMHWKYLELRLLDIARLDGPAVGAKQDRPDARLRARCTGKLDA